MKIAVVGAGVSGLVAARELAREHEVHLFEAAPRAGGHAYTVEVEEDGQRIPIDMGFIVYNERNYPHFSRLLSELGVATATATMGFSVHCPESGFEYSGESLAGLVARRRNLVSPRFWRLVAGILRFHRAGERELAAGGRRSLGEFCRHYRLSETAVRDYLLPMAGAIWSMPRQDVLDFPAATLLAFFRQHGLLSLGDRPVWRTVVGGSRQYVDALIERCPAEVRLGAEVRSIRSLPEAVELRVDGDACRFDEVVVATHSDQALALLAAPTPAEREVLGAIPYRSNEAVLHCDRRMLPRRSGAWSSWNVALAGPAGEGIAITYLMTKLQPLPTRTPWCVTLNRTAAIDPATVRHRVLFAHPQFDEAAIAAQGRWAEISGRHRIHYCGAYWRHGFHEDGAWSGLRAARAVTSGRREAA